MLMEMHVQNKNILIGQKRIQFGNSVINLSPQVLLGPPQTENGYIFQYNPDMLRLLPIKRIYKLNFI